MARAPVGEGINALFIRNATFWGTAVSKNPNLGGTEGKLHTGKGAAAVLHALDDPIQILKVFPNEASDTRVLCERLIRPILATIARSGWALDWDVIDIWDGELGDL